MRRSQAFLFLAFYLIFGTLAVLTANGQMPPTPAPPLPPDPLQANVESTEGRSEAVPSGTASQVSDWALAGLVWSDACLAQKVMKKATRDAVDETQKAQYELLLSETDAIVAYWNSSAGERLPDQSSRQGPRCPIAQPLVSHH